MLPWCLVASTFLGCYLLSCKQQLLRYCRLWMLRASAMIQMLQHFGSRRPLLSRLGLLWRRHPGILCPWRSRCFLLPQACFSHRAESKTCVIARLLCRLWSKDEVEMHLLCASGGFTVCTAKRILSRCQPQQCPAPAVNIHPVSAEVQARCSSRYCCHTTAD